jgi:DNA polymerase-1
MPSMGSKYGGGDFKVGGTLQGRFSCKKPAAQTYPPPIKKCISSRFEGGKVRVWDLSQIELRIAALLSGDPVMLREYEEGIDRHTNTALFFFPDADVTSDEFLRKPDGQRQCGKTTNFLVLYKGGAEKLQETIMKDLGIHVDLAICMQAIAMFDAKYAPFRAWQDMLINTVAERGYIELITGWSRFWGAGKRAASENINEICDFPIQTIAAQILQSSHFEIEKGLYSNGLRSLFFLQQHDSLFVDQYPGEEKIITKIVKKHLTSPPIFDIICNELGRTVPLEFEEETK